MPLLMLWGHGSFRTEYGYFKVPAKTRIEFFVDDNMTIDDHAIKKFENGDLSQGVTDELVGKAAKLQKVIGRVTKSTGDLVKNYKLESIIGDFFASSAKNALKNENVWTPGKETSNSEEITYLIDIVRGHAHRGQVADPLVLQWCACTSNYIGDDESAVAIPMGKKKKVERGSSCCYITTATCTALGLLDDCVPLNKLRDFRDHFLLQDPLGCRDVQQYYRVAPAIVHAIDRSGFPAAAYRSIFDDHLAPALNAIDNGDPASAHAIYATMVHTLEKRFLRP